MIYRKIIKRLERFYQEGGRTALLIDGARQVGKTFIVEEFGRTHYESVVKIDFVKMKHAVKLFENVEDESEIISRISAFTSKPLIEGKTLIFLDEVQKCPEAVTYIKYLVRDDGRYHYILSGSLLGVELKNIRSVPVGVLDEVTMYPLDFEEFVLANGESPGLIAQARSAWENRKPLPKILHDRLRKLFRFYLVVGGMPAVVQRYLDTKDVRRVIDEQKKILVEYRKDISQYDEANSMRIREVFKRIAPELNKKNKRFYSGSVGETGRFDRLEDEFVWLREAGVAIPAYNVAEPKVPLKLSEKNSFFKLFANDVGLLSAMMMGGIQLRILNDEADMNFGAVYENAVAQELVAHGFAVRYYNSSAFGEVDFVVEKDCDILPIEVKSGKHYKRHRALSRLMESAEYEIKSAIVFDDDALDVNGNVFYAPIYMMMFLENDVMPDSMVHDIGKPLELEPQS